MDPSGICVMAEKSSAVSKWPRPQCKKYVESYLGFMNYRRKFMPKFAEIADCLYQLTVKKAQFHWNEEHETAFKT